MSMKLFCWDKGNTRIYTKKMDIVNKAIKEGHLINVINDKPYIYNKDLFLTG